MFWTKGKNRLRESPRGDVHLYLIVWDCPRTVRLQAVGCSTSEVRENPSASKASLHIVQKPGIWIGIPESNW